MKIFRNVRALKFKVTFDGKGCVNCDGSDQRYTLWKKHLLPQPDVRNNCTFSKKEFKQKLVFNVSTGEYEIQHGFVHKVSTDCLKENLFKEEIQFENSAACADPYLRCEMISQPVLILRGYLYPNLATIKKKSGLTLTAAKEQVEGGMHTCVHLDIHSNAGNKSDNKTSLHYKENVPDAKYVSEGYLDLTELQFISGDTFYDRSAVDFDGGEYEEHYIERLKKNFDDTNIHFDFYYMKNSIYKDECGERGILLSQKSVDMLVKLGIKRIMQLNITRSDAIFSFESIQVEVVMGDGMEESTTESIRISTIKDLNNYQFEYFQKYLKADEEKIMENFNRAKECEKKQKEEIKKRRLEKNKQETDDVE